MMNKLVKPTRKYNERVEESSGSTSGQQEDIEFSAGVGSHYLHKQASKSKTIFSTYRNQTTTSSQNETLQSFIAIAKDAEML